ncbi:MAG TPA: ATP-binding protein [Polyangia bacterium]|nr:ATP-binding protein [Polyangia bacterium]
MTPSVLIVDDDDALAENIAEIVQTLDVDTRIAPDRHTALGLAAEHDFDVALVDVRLPDGDGLSLLAPLRERCPFVQSVMVTGDATVEGAIAAVRVAAFAYVLKPASPPDLLDTVQRALAQSAILRERERLRRELERSEARHRAVVESIPAFVATLDEGGRITTWNRQLELTTGFARDEMLGTDGRDLVGRDEEARALPAKNGPPRRARWNRAEIEGPDGRRAVYAVGIDVTDEQEMLRRLLRSERLAAVGTMAAGLAHEVRNPLNSASLQLTLLERRLDRGEGAEAIRPIAHIIKSEIDRLDRLVRDFLAFARPRPHDATPVDVVELVTSLATLIAPVAESADVKIVEELPPSAKLAIVGDAERLRQVLHNLTRNALEAMQGRGGRLTMRARADGDAVEIDVEDDGPGFAEDLPVFDAFFTTKEHGTGLGLSLVHRVVTDHGGTIRVQSRPGRTCFTLRLPAAR